MGSDHVDLTASGNDGSPSHVEATQKSIAILGYLKDNGQTTLTDLASALDHSKSTIHRHLATLESAGFVTATEGGYRVGLVFLDFGVHAQHAHELYQAGKAKVDDLAQRVDEKVWLMTEENGYGIFIYHCQGRDVFRTYTRIGYRGHLHAFAAGKAVLAHLPEDHIDRIISRHGLPSYTPHTTTDRGVLSEELESVRSRGVAFNLEESINGVNALAAPVLDGGGAPVGSISVAGPASRVSGSYLERELAGILLGVANEIEVRLEYE